MKSQTILQIAVPTPLRKSFDYLPPDACPEAAQLRPGIRIKVPFGNQQMTGILLATKPATAIESGKLKPAIAILDREPLLSPALMALMQWASDYYQHPVGECLATALPNLLRKGEPLLEENRRLWRLANPGFPIDDLPQSASAQRQLVSYLSKHSHLADAPKNQHGFSSTVITALAGKGVIEAFEQPPQATADSIIHHGNFTPNPQQAALIKRFKQRAPGFDAILLEGITGSGKTEIYLQLIASVLREGKQALVLVPEIGLTPQTLSRFEQRFGCPLAIFHSSLTDRQRLQHWQQARSGEARIIIGTRSALFTATANLGLIIIDEEHDLSYKQQDGLRYSARDLACVRAKLENIPILLGSATPTLESLYNCEQGKYQHWQLTERAGHARPPAINLLNIRNQPMSDGIADAVLPEIKHCLQRGEQALVFINRRGYAPSLICHECGWVGQCHACDARLTIHLGARHLRCHHCQAIAPIPDSCPACQSNELVYTGAGTERVEHCLQQHFPGIPLFRIDRDTTSTKNAMPEMLAHIHKSAAAILVGTQMLAKGHHFPNVTLVVVLEADAALMGSDYRATERFGQLLTQVTGRAGREQKPGRAIIQTHYPDHPQLNKLIHHGYHRFAMDLLAERRQLNLPPFSYQALVRLEDRDARQALETLQRLKQSIPQPPCHCLGPFPASLQRRAHYFRYQLLISASSRNQLKQGVTTLISTAEKIVKPHKQRWSIDIDPQEMN